MIFGKERCWLVVLVINHGAQHPLFSLHTPNRYGCLRVSKLITYFAIFPAIFLLIFLERQFFWLRRPWIGYRWQKGCLCWRKWGHSAWSSAFGNHVRCNTDCSRSLERSWGYYRSEYQSSEFCWKCQRIAPLGRICSLGNLTAIAPASPCSKTNYWYFVAERMT